VPRHRTEILLADKDQGQGRTYFRRQWRRPLQLTDTLPMFVVLQHDLPQQNLSTIE
jgi:hypothetical protein